MIHQIKKTSRKRIQSFDYGIDDSPLLEEISQRLVAHFSFLDDLVEKSFPSSFSLPSSLESFSEEVANYFLLIHPHLTKHLLIKGTTDAALFHKGQKRDSGKPYLLHVLYVAGIAVDFREDINTVLAGLFHDSLEDALSQEQREKRASYLKENYGPEVFYLVKALTKNDSLSREERLKEQYRFENLEYNPLEQKAARLKLYDVLANLFTLEMMKGKVGLSSKERQQRFVNDIIQYMLPVAHRLDQLRNSRDSFSYSRLLFFFIRYDTHSRREKHLY